MWPALAPLPCAGARTIEALERALAWYLERLGEPDCRASYLAAIENDRYLDFSERDHAAYGAFRQIVEALDYIEGPQVVVKKTDTALQAMKAIARKGYIVRVEPNADGGHRATAWVVEFRTARFDASQLGQDSHEEPCTYLRCVWGENGRTPLEAVQALAGELGVPCESAR